jgi:RNA polymerase sigma-70 factor (ECF subfamily)
MHRFQRGPDIQQVVSERSERFGAIYRAHYRAVHAYVYRRLARREEVADVVAEVFVVAWRRLDDVPGGDQTLLWLYGAAHRTALNWQRSARRRSRLTGRLREDARPRVTESEDPRYEEVRAAIDRLRPQDREVLRLVIWEALSHSEAAQVLGCSTNAVAQRLRTARDRLRTELMATESDVRARSVRK